MDLGLKHLMPPDDLQGIENAAARLVHAIQHDEHILIAGDFDADGATGCALCVSTLRDVGARNVSFAVPDRANFGYGLTQPFVAYLLKRKPSVIVTIDNGISSNEGVEFAREHGIDVVVTDHHLPPDKLPPANAIVNPQLSDNFRSEPAGVGVACYVMSVVRRQLRELGYFEKSGIQEPHLGSVLDLVALGTVADLVPMDRNNRVLVSNGLNRIRQGRARPGIVALCEIARVSNKQIKDEDIAFRLAPRLNAAGRLADMTIGIQALLADDIGQARKLVGQLDSINRERRDIQFEMTNSALSLLEQYDYGDRSGVCIYSDDYHEGVVGLVASKIVETLNKPSIVFAKSQGSDSTILKGSARTVAEVHIRDVLADIDAKYPALLLSYGGHAMAAGLSIRESSIERFRNLFDEAVTSRSSSLSNSKRLTDGELDGNDHTLDLVSEIDQFGPWGPGFERPMFHGTFEVLHEREVGRGKHLQLVLRKQGANPLDAIAFNQQSINAKSVEISYRIASNSYQTNSLPQLIVDSISPS